MIEVHDIEELWSPDFDELKARMKSPVIFDGRNPYNAQRMGEMGFEYHQIGN